MSVTVGLIALFRDRGATLTPENLSRMGRFTSDTHGRGLLEKWGKMKDLPAPLHVGEEDIMRILKVSDIEHLLFEWLRLGIELTDALNEWNSEFVKIKYLQGEFKWKYDHKTREANILEEELSECRTELANTMQSISLQNRQADQHQIDLAEARTIITQLLKYQKASKEKIVSLEAKNKRSQTLIAEKEAAFSGSESSKIIEDFKKSIAFKTIIQDHVQEARDHIYDIKVKALEQQCIEDGFIRGFLKGVRLMQRKTGALDDFPSGSDGDEIESEFHKAFDLDVDNETVDIE
ncbi:hypothetical protein IEQ34_015237 [Dendrobium chrysotoxum]|uniref:Uncharacterized protein n=1 Tax=Dendrobium chrysotoxum TaxID=161865 RepID=A0AAV7FZK1_DENCH|nr:hypothetical protein IEQ34_015237 [Dendrobium chrysotoxum]